MEQVTTTSLPPRKKIGVKKLRKLKPGEVAFPRKQDFLRFPMRYKVLHGGRGSAKSWGVARMLLILGSMKKLRILCAREFQNSIADSVHKLLCDQVDSLGLTHFYGPGITRDSIRGINGTQFIFTGVRNNVTKVKSMEGIDICWVEEAEKVSSESWLVLIPTIRKTGSEIWITFNPSEESDPTYVRFVLNTPPDAKVVVMNWRENPWFPEELRKEKDYLARVDVDAYEHVWEGKCRTRSKAQVLGGKYKVEAFVPGKDWDGPYQGADWGFSVDPTTLVRLWIHSRTLYVEYECYGVGVEIDHTPQLFDQMPDARKYVTRGDNARPETISYLQRTGYDSLRAAFKWPGSVEEGVTFLRNFEWIVIHPRCTHAIQEARLYSYKVDRLTNDVLPELVDAHNHIWDAVRYALEPIIRGSGLGMLSLLREEKSELDARIAAEKEQEKIREQQSALMSTAR